MNDARNRGTGSIAWSEAFRGVSQFAEVQDGFALDKDANGGKNVDATVNALAPALAWLQKGRAKAGK